MKPELKARWVEALRSGKYKQTEGSLASGGCFCALGVACEIFAEEAGIVVQDYGGRKIYDGSGSHLPPKLSDFLGLTVWGDFTGPMEIEGENYSTVADLNDRAKLTFREIADIIEKKL